MALRGIGNRFLGTAASFYQPAAQLQSALHTRSTYTAFAQAPSVETAWNLGGNIIGVIGTPRVVGALVKYGVKLALKSRAVDKRIGTEMVELMKSRVPVDTGRLLNGITMEDDGDMTTISASAVRGNEDYAAFVEFGTGDNAAVADDDFFANGSTAGVPLHNRHHAETPAEPFFWNSAREELAKYHKDLDDVINETSQEEGF